MPIIIYLLSALVMPDNIKYPTVIEAELKQALLHYPELLEVPIEVRFKKNIKNSTMVAQPILSTITGSKDRRRYKILISERFKMADTAYQTIDLPTDVMVGWLGHELGHILDYHNMSNQKLIGFGFRYIFYKEHIIKAERSADSIAVAHGMTDYIIAAKNFVFHNDDIESAYKHRVEKYYMSPKEVKELLDDD